MVKISIVEDRIIIPRPCYLCLFVSIAFFFFEFWARSVSEIFTEWGVSRFAGIGFKRRGAEAIFGGIIG